MLKILKARQAQWEENFIPRIHTFNVDFKRTVKMSHLFCFVSLIKNVLNSCSLQKFVQDGYILLLLDYTNQGHLTKFRTNLMEKIVNVYSSFSTNYPCIQAVYHTGNRFLVILDNFWKTIVNFNDFYLLNLWKILLGGLG